MIYHIAAITKNNGIGYKNDLITRSKEDSQYFKQLTSNQIVVMGRKTFESMGSKPLPNRINIIITSDENYNKNSDLILKEGTEIHYLVIAKNSESNLNININRFLNLNFAGINKDIYIIGGGEIYKQTMDIVDELIISQFDIEVEADTFYPEIDDNIWQLKTSDVRNDFAINTFKKIN